MDLHAASRVAWVSRAAAMVGQSCTLSRRLLPVTWGRVTNQSTTHSVTAAAVAVRTARIASFALAPFLTLVGDV